MTTAPTIAEQPSSERGKLLGVEIIRGCAALLIVLHHAGRLLQQDRYGASHVLNGIYGEFHLGVDFFFVLSGFIITWVHWDDLGCRHRLKHYAVRRFTRIYPAYWALLLPLTALYHYFSSSGEAAKHDWMNFVVSFFLLPTSQEMILGVAWTLAYEVFFYVIFGALIAMGRKGIVVLFLWAFGIAACAASGTHNFMLSFAFSPYNLEFLMGIAAALLLRRYSITYAWLAALAGLGVFIGCMLGRVALTFIDDPLTSRVIFGIAAMTALIGFVELERSGRLRIPPILQIFGAMSYSLYLVHPVAESLALFTLWHSVLRYVAPEIVFAFLVVTGVAAGFVFHKLVERPVMARARRLLGN